MGKHRSSTPLLMPAIPTMLVATQEDAIEGNVNFVSINSVPLLYVIFSHVDDKYNMRQVLHHDDKIAEKFLIFKQTM